MNKEKSSLTSLVSTFARVYHSEYDQPKVFDDFVAKNLITQKEFAEIRENMIDGVPFFNEKIARQFQDQPDEILKWITQVQLSPTPLARAAYCESVLLHEIRLGVKQYVILGAGMDTFSLRHPELREQLKIFEVDHPATQAFKRERVTHSDYEVPTNLSFIPMDFTRGFTEQPLVEAGFSPGNKTFFSLLGVSYYLTKEENADLLKRLFAKVPSGSSIVFDYPDDTLFDEKGISNRVQHMVQMAAASGEPMKSSFSFNEMEKILEDAGLLIYEHLSPETIQKRFFMNRSDYLTAFETVHYIHAVKK